MRSMKTKVESVAAGEDKETGLDVEACGVVVVVLEGELRCVCATASRQTVDLVVGARE